MFGRALELFFSFSGVLHVLTKVTLQDNFVK